MKPIMFSTPMVKAIMNGSKTVTRRRFNNRRCRWRTGDVLWVKETWAYSDVSNQVIYRADCDGEGMRWNPSMFMPLIHARLFLDVVEVNPGLLRSMTHADAIAEGVGGLKEFRELWISINKAWDPQTMVLVVKFRRRE